MLAAGTPQGRYHRRAGLAIRAALVMGVLLAATATAKPPAREVEEAWTHPEFARFGLVRVAILPAATYDANDEASSAVAAGWLAGFDSTGYAWIPADRVRLTLRAASVQRDSLVEVIEAQVERAGRVESGTARDLGRLLGVPALLCLRVERWQIQNSASARQTATVELAASLVDTAGTELWRVRGRTVYEGPIVNKSFVETPMLPGRERTTTTVAQGGGSASGSGSSSSSSASAGGSSGGGSSGGSSSGGSSSGSSTTLQRVPVQPQATTPSWMEPDLYAPDLPAVYRGALDNLYGAWIKVLPPTGKAARP